MALLPTAMIARLPAVILVLYRTFQLSDASFNFSPYLVCAQTYLYSNAPAECDYGDTSVESTTEEDICLCSSASFLDGVARDVWQNCGCEALTNTANQIVNVCMEYNVDPLYDAQQIIQNGDGGQSTCQDPSTSTISSPESSTSSSSPSTSTEPATAPPSPPSNTSPSTLSTSTTTTASSVSSSSASPTSNSSTSEAIGLAKESNKIALACGIAGVLATLIVGIFFRKGLKTFFLRVFRGHHGYSLA